MNDGRVEITTTGEPVGVAVETVSEGETLRVLIFGRTTNLFVATEDIPAGNFVSLTRTRWERIKDWFRRKWWA